MLVALVLSAMPVFPQEAEARTVTARELERKLKASLPVSEARFYPSTGDAGTVALILQSHQEPFSRVSDPKNDGAKIAQEDILLILNKLYSAYGMDLLMIEGELYGQVSPARMAWVKDKLSTYLFYKDKISEAQREYMERELLLIGAGYLIKAKESNLALYGAEEKDTQDRSKHLVRQYLSAQNTRTAEFAEIKKAMQRVLIDQRDVETAYNMKRAMMTSKEKTGMLVFGAQHEEGLIRELKKQGLSVLVIAPDSL